MVNRYAFLSSVAAYTIKEKTFLEITLVVIIRFLQILYELIRTKSVKTYRCLEQLQDKENNKITQQIDENTKQTPCIQAKIIILKIQKIN